MKIYKRGALALLSSSILLMACADEPRSTEKDSRSGEVETNSLDNNKNNEISQSFITYPPIPSMATPEASCVEGEYWSLEICDWTQSLDDAIIAYILDTEIIRSPAKVSVNFGPTIDAEECTGTINPGLKLTVRVDASMHNRLEIGEEIDIYMGRNQFLNWSATPQDNMDGEVVWRNNPRISDIDSRIIPGQHLGLPIHWVEDDGIWSLMGEQLFSIVENDDGTEVIRFQRENGICAEDYPSELNNMTLSELFDKARACDSETTKSVQRKNSMFHNYGRSVNGYRAASCSGMGSEEYPPVEQN